MLDIKFIRENLEQIKQTCEQKNCRVDLDKLISLADERGRLIQQTDEIKAKKNQASKGIATMQGDEKQKAIDEMQTITKEEKTIDAKLREIEHEYGKLMLLVPQPCAPETPIGKDDSDNKEEYKNGEVPNFDFEIQDHVTLGENLDIIDIPRAAKVAGSRNYYLKGAGAMLEFAILQYTLNKLVAKGFTVFNPPQIVNYQAMMGTSYFPGGEEQAYAVGVDMGGDKRAPKAENTSDTKNNESETPTIPFDQKYLIGTSEVPVASYHMDEILDESALPKLYAGYSSCYRREAGTYGKDTHGLYRVHQFYKVEQVVLCKNDPEESKKMHQMLLKNAEEILQDLKLPYRVVNVCTGDIGQGQYFKNDIETWMPSRENYGETHSCSTFLEFQSRRLNIRYRNKEGKISYVHTLNNTAIASPRILIPLLEVYQNADGSINIPEILQPYMGGVQKIEK